VSGTWTDTRSLAAARVAHTATLLPDGNVLVAGGFNLNALASAELYNAASGTWTTTSSLAEARDNYTATLLPNSKILVVGGEGASHVSLASAELYDVGLGFSSDWQPEITSATIKSHNRLILAGSRFQGISQASGGNTQDSSSNYPIVQLRSIDSSEVVFVQANPLRRWSDRRFISLPVGEFHSGPALVTVFTNGIPSAASYVVVGP
jgi:Galactose oxidase, central domain